MWCILTFTGYWVSVYRVVSLRGACIGSLMSKKVEVITVRNKADMNESGEGNEYDDSSDEGTEYLVIAHADVRPPILEA